MTLVFFICVCIEPSLSKCTPGAEEAGGVQCPTEPPGFTRLYQLHPKDPSKGTAVMNYPITPPHTDTYKQWFSCIHKHVFENSASLDLNAERRDSLTVRCLCVFLYPFFLRSAFCQWFCSLCFTPGGLDFWLKWLLRCVWQSLVFCMLAPCSSYLSHEERRRPIPASTRAGSERSSRQWSNWALHEHTNTLVTYVTDTKDKLNYPRCYWTQGQQLLNALHPLSKQTPWSVRSSFQSDWQIRMTVSSTPRCPIPSPHSACQSQSACSEQR